MLGYIDGFNFGEMNAMKYHSHPSTWDNEKKKADVKAKIFSGEWYGAEKKDGYFAKLVKDEDGAILLYSRSRNTKGEYVNKVEWVPQFNDFFERLPSGTCLLGEIYFPSNPGSRNVTTIMQCLKEKAISRQQSGEKLYFYIFDVLAYNGTSYMNEHAIKRFDMLKEVQRFIGPNIYVSVATYYNGSYLWANLQEILARGDEGIVITKYDGIYEPDKRPSRTTLKVKKELQDTIDCFFTGRAMAPTKIYSGKEIGTWKYWERLQNGEKIYGEYFNEYFKGAPIIPVTKSYYLGYAGSLEIGVYDEDHVVIPIGFLSGLTEEIKADPRKYAMKTIEVTAMEIDLNEGVSLRHGKMLRFRDDITPDDCTLEKIIETH